MCLAVCEERVGVVMQQQLPLLMLLPSLNAHDDGLEVMPCGAPPPLCNDRLEVEVNAVLGNLETCI